MYDVMNKVYILAKSFDSTECERMYNSARGRLGVI